MSLTALLLSAAAAATVSGPEPAATETPNLWANAVPEHCRVARKVDRPTPVVPQAVPPLSFRLGDLPPADVHLLIDRRVDGCPVPTIIRYGYDATFPRGGTPQPPAAPQR